MGLDQYLEAKIYIGGKYHYIKEKQLTVSRVMKCFGRENYEEARIIPTENLSSANLRVGYWRKAYQIHDWFIDNLQDDIENCREAYVSEENLDQLEKLVKDVLADHSKAKELLPQSEYDYDEHYFADLERTLDIIKTAREHINKYGASIYYEASW